MLLQAAPAAAPQQQQRQQAPPNPHMALAEDGSARAPAAFIQSVKAAPDVMAQIAATSTALADAIRMEDVEAVQVGIIVNACMRIAITYLLSLSLADGAAAVAAASYLWVLQDNCR